MEFSEQNVNVSKLLESNVIQSFNLNNNAYGTATFLFDFCFEII